MLSLVVLTTAGCGKSYTYNYRITVSVRDHNRLAKASDVVRVTEEAVGTHAKVAALCGEALTIKLSTGKYLVTLLSGSPLDDADGVHAQWRDSPTNIFLVRLKLPLAWSYSDDSGVKKLSSVRDVVHLTAYEMPEIVLFDNLNDPTTIKRVDPKESRLLGDGINIEDVSVQVTDDDVSQGRLAATIPWLNASNDYLDGSQFGRAVKGYHSFQFVQCK